MVLVLFFVFLFFGGEGTVDGYCWFACLFEDADSKCTPDGPRGGQEGLTVVVTK